VERHLRTLATLHIIYGCLMMFWEATSLVLLGFLGYTIGDLEHLLGRCPLGQYDFWGFLEPIYLFAFFLTYVLAAAAILGGLGLYNRQNWGRLLILVLGVLFLFRIPFGTVLGIYTLWVLTKPEATQLTRG
jgi:hypothetical protein